MMMVSFSMTATIFLSSLGLFVSLSAIEAFVPRQRSKASPLTLPPPTFRQDRATSISSSTALSMAITLYGHPGTRSPLINWGAYEVGVDIIMGDLSKNPHPFGQIPCLTDSNDDDMDDDDLIVVFESGAILLYLHDQTKSSMMTPQDAAAVTSWITWANASLDPICFLETSDGKVYDTGFKRPNKRLDTFNDLLETRTFLLGDDFSLADVAVASYLLYVLQFFPGVDISRWPHMKRYMKDCAQRKAYGKAFGEKTQKYLVEQLEAEPKQQQKLFGLL